MQPSRQSPSGSSRRSDEHVPQPSNAQELEGVLMQMCFPDTQQVQQATAILKKFLKKSACVMPLIEQVCSSGQLVARQMAGVLLREKISSHWKRLPAADKAQIKSALLERLAQEPKRPVRLSVAALVSSIAKHTVPVHQWDELLEFLFSMSQSEHAEHREVSMMLFRQLADSVGMVLQPHFATLQSIFHRGLADPSSLKVRVEAMRALGCLVEFLSSEKEVMEFQVVIPALLEVARFCLQQRQEETDVAVMVCFEVFETLSETSLPVLDPHLPQAVAFMLEVVVSRDLSIGFRDMACNFVGSLAENKPRKLQKANLVQDVVRACFMLYVEPFAEGEADATVMTPHKMGINLLDSIVIAMPKHMIYEIVLQNALQLTKSENPHERKGGLTAIAVLAEGCSELMRMDLDSLLKVVYAGVEDSNPLVRSAAQVALTQFSDHLQPDIVEHHATLLPHIFMALDNESEANYVRWKACICLEALSETLGEDVLQYLEPLMTKLISLISSCPDPKIRQTAVSAVKGVALACRTSPEAFLPYAEAALQPLQGLLQATEDTLLILRAKATESVGAIALTVGKERFMPVLEPYVHCAIQGTSMQFFELREAGFTFFAYIAEMLEDDFEQLLPRVMPLLLASIQSDDGVMVYVDEDDMGLHSGVAGAFADSDDEHDGGGQGHHLGGGGGGDAAVPEEEAADEDLRKVNMSIRSGALDEKVAALACLEEVAKSVNAPLLPYVGHILEVVSSTAEYPHHFVRNAIVCVMHELIRFAGRAYPSPPFQPGEVAPIQPGSAAILDKVLPTLLLRMDEDRDMPTVARAVEAVAEAMKLFGMSFLGQCVTQLVPTLQSMLSEEAPCQIRSDDVYDESQHEDHDEVLIDMVTDCVAMIAEVGGPQAVPVLEPMLPLLSRFLQPNRPAFDRSMSIGCYGEIASHIGPAIAPYASAIWPFAIQGLGDEEIAVRRNSAFTAGTLFQVAAAQSSPFLQDALEALQQLYAPLPDDSGVEQDSFLATRDNACSAVSKIIMAQPPNLPLPDAVALMLHGLPLAEDMEEAKHVYPCLSNLFMSAPEVMAQHIPHTINVCGSVLMDDRIDDDIRHGMAQLLGHLGSNCAAQAQQAIAGGHVNPELQPIVLQYLNE